MGNTCCAERDFSVHAWLIRAFHRGRSEWMDCNIEYTRAMDVVLRCAEAWSQAKAESRVFSGIVIEWVYSSGRSRFSSPFLDVPRSDIVKSLQNVPIVVGMRLFLVGKRIDDSFLLQEWVLKRPEPEPATLVAAASGPIVRVDSRRIMVESHLEAKDMFVMQPYSETTEVA